MGGRASTQHMNLGGQIQPVLQGSGVCHLLTSLSRLQDWESGCLTKVLPALVAALSSVLGKLALLIMAAIFLSTIVFMFLLLPNKLPQTW